MTVEIITQTFDQFLTAYGMPALLLMATLILLAGVQLKYYLHTYGRIPAYRVGKGHETDTEPVAVSVVVVVQDDYSYLDEVLPLLLSQDYPRYEVVVVDLGSTEDFSDALSLLRENHRNLVTTRMEQDPRFPISHKLALNVGIKAARYEHLLITSTAARPTSDRWLPLMAKGFLSGDVVLGYCGIERKKGLANKLIRCSRVATSIRSLSCAVRGLPYKGCACNIGYTKSLYFGVRGFNYLNLNTGEDDLFLQTIATGDNTSVIMNPKATVRQWQWGGMGWWHNVRKFDSYTYRYYPLSVKNAIQCELVSRFLFFAAVLTALCCLPLPLKIVAGSLAVVRLGVVEFSVWRIRRRLGEGGLAFVWILYDLAAPLVEAQLWLSRTLRPSNGLWR